MLTQNLTDCPDTLLVLALAISVQSCLDLVFGRVWLCFSLFVLVLIFTLAALWRSCPCLCALVHALVPLGCIYFVWFALPGADAMEDASFSGFSSGDYACTQELSSLSADTWEAFAFYFKNMAKLKRIVLPFCLPVGTDAPDLFDVGCMGDYDDVIVSEGEDPGDCEAKWPAEAAPMSLPFLHGMGCLFRSSVTRTLPCMA